MRRSRQFQIPCPQKPRLITILTFHTKLQIPFPKFFQKCLKEERTPRLAFSPNSCPDLQKVSWGDIDPHDYPLLFSESDYDDYFEQGEA